MPERLNVIERLVETVAEEQKKQADILRTLTARADGAGMDRRALWRRSNDHYGTILRHNDRITALEEADEEVDAYNNTVRLYNADVDAENT